MNPSLNVYENLVIMPLMIEGEMIGLHNVGQCLKYRWSESNRMAPEKVGLTHVMWFSLFRESFTVMRNLTTFSQIERCLLQSGNSLTTYAYSNLQLAKAFSISRIEVCKNRRSIPIGSGKFDSVHQKAPNRPLEESTRELSVIWRNRRAAVGS
jgi:hypothetical protein